MDSLTALLAQQESIPHDWRGKYVFFRDTVFLGSCGNKCVECIFYDVADRTWRRVSMDVRWVSRIQFRLVLESASEFISVSPAYS